MTETVALSLELVMNAVKELDWKFKQETEDEITVTFSSHGKPKIHVSLKVVGTRVVATSAIDLPIARDRWASTLVDINEFHARNYRPKVYLSMTPDADTAMYLGEEVLDAHAGTTAELLGAWVGGHAAAFAKSVTQVLRIDLT